MEEKKCHVLVEGKECGLPLTKIDWETDLGIFECALGHLPLTKIDWETDLGIFECALGHYSYSWKVQKKAERKARDRA